MMKLSPKVTAMIDRRMPIVLIAAALGVLGAWVAAVVPETTYSARAVVVVPVFNSPANDAADPAVEEPALGRPLDASRLARTYASLLVEDITILDAVSAATDRSTDELAAMIDVENQADTPLIEIVVSGSDPDVVADVLSSFVGAVAGADPASPSIAPDSLQAVRIADPVASTSTGLIPAIPAGLLIGAAIGAVVGVFWERSQPRIDLAAELSAHLGVPTRDIEKLADGIGAWILKRWAELAGADGWVLVVACEPVTLSGVTAVGAKLAETFEVERIDRPREQPPRRLPPDRGNSTEKPVDVRTGPTAATFIVPTKSATTSTKKSTASVATTTAGRPTAAAGSTEQIDDNMITDLLVMVPFAGDGDAPGRLLVTPSYGPGHPDGFELAGVRPGLVVIAVARGTAASQITDTVDILAGVDLVPGYALLLD